MADHEGHIPTEVIDRSEEELEFPESVGYSMKPRYIHSHLLTIRSVYPNKKLQKTIDVVAPEIKNMSTLPLGFGETSVWIYQQMEKTYEAFGRYFDRSDLKLLKAKESDIPEIKKTQADIKRIWGRIFHLE